MSNLKFKHAGHLALEIGITKPQFAANYFWLNLWFILLVTF